MNQEPRPLSDAEIEAWAELRRIVAKLRLPDGGCPWDLEQTHQSLRPYVIEEAYEVLAALDANDMDALPEELGDLLLQVLLHTQLAEEAGEFEMTRLLTALAAKLVRRHPHVFGDAQAADAAAVIEQWDRLKKAERAPDTSALASVPRALPALGYARELLGRAERAGFAWPDRRDVIDKVAEELEELANAPSKAAMTEELGDLLLNLANYARYLDIDAEEALRLAANKFRARFESVERLAAGTDLSTLSREELMSLWSEAKKQG